MLQQGRDRTLRLEGPTLLRARFLDSSGISRDRWLLLGLLAVALVLRMPGLSTELWLDELWSLDAVERMPSAVDVFTGFKSDNNHHLNSLWLYAVGPGAAAPSYRILALIGSLAGVVFAWLLGRRDGLTQAIWTALLVAGAFPLVLYASEARGYASVVAAALGAWYCLLRFADRPGWARAWPFWVCLLVGLLSHLSIVYTLVGSGVWLGVRERLRRGSWAGAVVSLFQALGIPIAAAAAFAWLVLRGSVLGGGPPYSLPALLSETVASGVGVLGTGASAVAAGAVVSLLFVESLWWQARRGDDRWVFYAATVVVGPALVLLAARPPFLFVRYFSIQVGFMLVAIAAPWSARWSAGGVRRVAAVCLLAAFLSSNLMATMRFWALGRGAYREALSDICTDAGHRPVAVASDHDFRNGMLVRYFAKHGKPGCDIAYVKRDALPTGGADWFVGHQVGPTVEPRREIADVHGNRYRLARQYPAHELSGLSWYVYRAERGGPAEKP